MPGSVAPADPLRSRPSLLQFTLETLLLVMTLVATGLGLLVAVPPLGAWFVVIGGLALVRTIVECRRFLQDGRPLLLADKLGSFFGSLGYSFLAVVCSMIVFGMLSVFAMAVAGIVAQIMELVGSPPASDLVLAIIGFVATLPALAVTAMSFFSVYWKTILPRTTLDPPTPRQSVPENASR